MSAWETQTCMPPSITSNLQVNAKIYWMCPLAGFNHLSNTKFDENQLVIV